MKTTIEQKELLKALNAVKTVVPRKPHLPALTNVLLDVNAGKMTITGTDMKNTIQVEVKAETTHPGTLLVHCSDFINAVRSCNGSISLEQIGDRLSVMCGPAECQSGISILCADTEVFPRYSLSGDVEVCHSLLLPGAVAKLKAAVKFVAKERTRPALTGVLVELQDGGLIITATDGHRLANFTLTQHPGRGDFIIPVFTINQIAKHKKASWYAYFYDDRVTFSAGDIKISSRLIEGPYPNYRQVMPADLANAAIIGRKALLSAVVALLPCSNEITRRIVFTFNSDLEISASNVDKGTEGKNQVPHKYTGAALTIAFNGLLVKDILDTIDSEKVTWRTDSAESASIIEPIDDSSARFLLMPLRVND